MTRPLLSAGWTVAERFREDAGWDEGKLRNAVIQTPEQTSDFDVEPSAAESLLRRAGAAGSQVNGYLGPEEVA